MLVESFYSYLTLIALFNVALAVGVGEVAAGEIRMTGCLCCCCFWMFWMFACWKRLCGMTMTCCGPDSVTTVFTVAAPIFGLEVGTRMSTILLVRCLLFLGRRG